jgi:ribosomal protein S18 acetylase RimI-like enzyme
MTTQTPLAFRAPDPAIHIRPVQLIDAASLHHNCWADRPQAVIYHLVSRAQHYAQQGRGLGAVVVVDGQPAGYGQVLLWPHFAEISDLIVTEGYRGRGLGTALIQYLVRAAREMQASAVEIGVAIHNPKALALYRRLGFIDHHQMSLNLGEGQEPVLFLRLEFD